MKYAAVLFIAVSMTGAGASPTPEHHQQRHLQSLDNGELKSLDIDKLKAQNAANVREVMALCDETDPEWEAVVKDGRCRVWRRRTEGSRHVLLLAKGDLSASAEAVYDLLADTSKASLYNEFIRECVDEEEDLGDNTKISWSTTAPVAGIFKSRDFVTLCHFTTLEGGARCVVNRATEHFRRPPTRGYCRGEIVLAANIVRPSKDGCSFTLLTQINPGGAVDFGPVAKVANGIVAKSPPKFMDEIERCANATPKTSSKLLLNKKRIRGLRRKAARRASKIRAGAIVQFDNIQSSKQRLLSSTQKSLSATASKIPFLRMGFPFRKTAATTPPPPPS